ncbi:MAG TPA: bifunctional oligoribonuclease/PAP phosphatase NrnA [bacterium]|nr:bifunctional oligoribonuclease/PAP phosphatase NrnA [bacterium]
MKKALTMSDDALQQAVSVIRNGRTFGVVSHVDPDGDAVGSIIAAMLMLRRLGKEVRSLQNDTIPDIYNFLPGYPLAAKVDAAPRRLGPGELDCVMIFDSSSFSRVAWDYDDRSVPAKKVINTDHHKDNALFGDVNIVDGKASSASELLFGIIDAFGMGDDVQIATNLFTGISTDTGSFSYSNTTPAALVITSRLVETGIDVAGITKHLECNFTLPRLVFFGKVLASAQSTEDGSLVWIVGTEKMRRESAFGGSTEQFTNYAMKVRAAEVAIFFSQDGADRCKVSIRSRGQIDARLLAASFGGGGHERAAGCIVRGSLDSVISDVVEAARSELKQAASSRRKASLD